MAIVSNYCQLARVCELGAGCVYCVPGRGSWRLAGRTGVNTVKGTGTEGDTDKHVSGIDRPASPSCALRPLLWSQQRCARPAPLPLAPHKKSYHHNVINKTSLLHPHRPNPTPPRPRPGAPHPVSSGLSPESGEDQSGTGKEL